jgi:hypothetical protein
MEAGRCSNECLKCISPWKCFIAGDILISSQMFCCHKNLCTNILIGNSSKVVCWLISIMKVSISLQGLLSWSWSYGSCIYIYLCNQCLSPLTLWVWILLRQGVLDTTLCDSSLSVTCDRSVVFSWCSDFLHQ